MDRQCAKAWSGARYGNYLEFDEASATLKAVHFKVLFHYYRPEDMPREQQPWLAIVCKALLSV